MDDDMRPVYLDAGASRDPVERPLPDTADAVSLSLRAEYLASVRAECAVRAAGFASGRWVERGGTRYWQVSKTDDDRHRCKIADHRTNAVIARWRGVEFARQMRELRP